MKKITAVFIATVMILTSFVCVAAETLAKPTAMYNYESGVLTVSGVADAEEVLTVYVVNPFHTKDEIGADTGALQNFRKITTNAQGKYTYSFKLANPEEGTYTIYVKSDSAAAVYTTIAYADSPALETLVSTILGEEDKDVVKEALTNTKNAENLQLDTFAPYVAADKDELAEMIVSVLKDKTASENVNADITEIISVVRANAVTQLYNAGNKDLIASGTTLLYDADLGLTSLDGNSMSFYSSYNTLVSENAKAEVINELLGKDFASSEDLLKAFAEEVILKGVANPKSLGFGHIAKLLTSANCAYVGMTYYAVNNAQATKIAELSEQETLTALGEQIKAIIDDPANSLISPGGGGATLPPSDNSYIGNGNGNTTVLTTPSGKNYFGDVSDYEWADEAIGYLYKEGIISGTSGSTFAPSDNLTREQFAKVLCLIADIQPKANEKFDDVEADSWYAPYIGALSDTGLVSGIVEGTFGVGYNITREDLCVMIYRAFADKFEAGNAKSFTDAASVSEYAKEAVNALSGAGILNGFNDGSFRPQANCTRAEMAKIVYEITMIIE